MEPQEILEAYRREFETYQALARRVEELLRPRLEIEPFEWSTSARAKHPANLVIKALKKMTDKPHEYLPDPVAAMKDKAGVRVIVPNLDAVRAVERAAGEIFEVHDSEDIGKRYRPDQLGYLGVHLQVSLKADTLVFTQRHFEGLQCEVQLHTKAQSAWATVSHPLLYKPVGAKPSEEVQARIMRAVALVSLFDDEIEAARMQVLEDPNYRPALMLDVLQKAALEWRTGDPDAEVSLAVLAMLEPLYEPIELAQYSTLMDEFIAERRQAIDTTYSQYAGSGSDLLNQPEALAIYERLIAKPELLRDEWLDSSLPVELLEDVAIAFGQAY